jgi:hypothetical protein
MAGLGFVLSGKKMTSDSVVFNATQGTRADGVFYAAVGTTAAAKYRRNEIITTWELCRDRLMKAMGFSGNILTTTQTELVCKVALPNVKNYSIVKQATTVAPEAGNIIFGFSYLAPTFVTGVPPDEVTWPHGGRPQKLGSLGLDAALDEIIHAYLRIKSKD